MRNVKLIIIVSIGIVVFSLVYIYCTNDGTEFKGGKVFQIDEDKQTKVDTKLPIEIQREIDSLNKITDSAISTFKVGPKIEVKILY